MSTKLNAAFEEYSKGASNPLKGKDYPVYSKEDCFAYSHNRMDWDAQRQLENDAIQMAAYFHENRRELDHILQKALARLYSPLWVSLLREAEHWKRAKEHSHMSSVRHRQTILKSAIAEIAILYWEALDGGPQSA